MFKKVEDVLVIRCAVKMFIKIILIFVVFNCGVLITSENTGLVKETEDQLLLLSTLDGFFICIERRTGLVRWKLKEEPVIRLPTNLDKSVTPFFLPDPTDGSLYLLNSNDRDALSKLPFTIPQLVASSPCRSSDGIIFTGKKLDTWFSVNPESGVKRSFLTYNSIDLTCSKEGPDIYIGRTEYNVVMVDTLKKERAWNVTFYDYLSYTMDTESKNKYSRCYFFGMYKKIYLFNHTNYFKCSSIFEPLTKQLSLKSQKRKIFICNFKAKFCFLRDSLIVSFRFITFHRKFFWKNNHS